MNTCYKHFFYFVTEFNLVEKKELEPLVRLDMSGLSYMTSWAIHVTCPTCVIHIYYTCTATHVFYMYYYTCTPVLHV